MAHAEEDLADPEEAPVVSEEVREALVTDRLRREGRTEAFMEDGITDRVTEAVVLPWLLFRLP